MAGAVITLMLSFTLMRVWITPLSILAVCYALFIYLLNLFLAFLQPKFDPSIEQDLAEQDVEEGAPGLPTSASSRGGGGLMSGVFGGANGSAPEEEFRPFIRRLPEFKVRGCLLNKRPCALCESAKMTDYR